MKNIWEAVKLVLNTFSTLTINGIVAISKLPDWVKSFIGIGFIFLILCDKSRKIIINSLQVIIQMLVDILKMFYDVFKNILNPIAPLIGLGTDILLFLFIKIEETITTYEQINLKQA